MKPVEVSLEQVLLARENRAGRQQRLLAQYGLPLVSFTMNIAGACQGYAAVALCLSGRRRRPYKTPRRTGFMLPDGSRDRLRGPAGI